MWKKQITSEAEQLVLAGVVEGEETGESSGDKAEGFVVSAAAKEEEAVVESGKDAKSEGKGTQGKKGKGKGKGKKKA